ncbi:MAG: hypothetical protein AAF405_03805 [Pseudomonadota bacterium]
MISVVVIVALVIALLLIARRSSKNRDTIIIEVLLGIAGSVVAALAVASFPKVDTNNFLGYLDTQIYELVFGKKTEDAPKPEMPEKKAVTVKKNVSVSDLKIEGVYAGLVRSIQNGSDVLSEKAYVLRVDPSSKKKLLEIYDGGELEYRVRIDGKLEEDGVTWVGETKDVLKGGPFVQDQLKLLVSSAAGRIDWHQYDKVQRIESIGPLYKVDEDEISNRVIAVNKIKDNIYLCSKNDNGEDASRFLFVPVTEGANGGAISLSGLASKEAIFDKFLAGHAKPYDGPYGIFFKTTFSNKAFPDLTGITELNPEFPPMMGIFDKQYSVGAGRTGQDVSWFKRDWTSPATCRVFFIGFAPAIVQPEQR